MRIFKLFRKHYKTGYVYKVKLDDIIIQDGWDYIRIWKMNDRMTYFEKTGRFYSPIVIDKDFVLHDGFTSYRIAQYDETMPNVKVAFKPTTLVNTFGEYISET